jgi:hypothetical protein
MPLSVPSEQQPTEVLGWLTSGPAPWLAAVADPLPAGTKQLGNVPAVSNNRLQISLSGQALAQDDPTAQDRLQKQLRWSLRPNLPAALELIIEHQPEQEYRGDDYLSSNAAYQEHADPQRFVVYDGQVRRLKRSFKASESVPVLPPAANRNVRMAAFSATAKRTYAALVVNDSGGKQSLRVGAAPTGEQGTLRRIALPKPIGKPVWAVSPPVGTADKSVGLVIAKNRLYSFRPDGGRATLVSQPPGLGVITAVAIAPDARRIALLAGHRLYLSTLSNDDGVQLSAPVQIRAEMNDLSAVAWSGEGTLVVAGVKADSGRAAIMDVSIDGATQTDRLADLGSNRVTYLTAYPASPDVNVTAAVPVAYVLGDAAYDESGPEKLDIGDLAVPVTNPRAGVPPPSAPLFLG